MTKEFCTYNQASALKELGFDEPCFVVWPGIEGQKLGYDGRYFSLVKGYKNSKLSKEVKKYAPGIIDVAAPLYQQAFRWFRDKYDLWCCIQKYPTSDNPKRCYYELKGDNINTDKDESPNSYMSGWFDSYEEAESACLDKLIEIIKSNYCHYSGLPSTSSYDQ
jgi:hypothetical protein